MQVRLHCPHCDLPMRLSRWESLDALRCPRCEGAVPTHIDAPARTELKIEHCLICASPELFRQKVFNRNFGVAIVVAGILVSFFVELMVVPLVIVALIDLLLYLLLPFMIVCYRCDAEFRGFKNPQAFQLFNHLKATRAKSEPVYPGAEEAEH